jgi:hypothetical protein
MTIQAPTDLIISAIRNRRDRLLNESDWTVLPDAPTDKEAWQTYRQELRDITNNLDTSSITQWDDQVALDFFPKQPTI